MSNFNFSTDEPTGIEVASLTRAGARSSFAPALCAPPERFALLRGTRRDGERAARWNCGARMGDPEAFGGL
jgi:hypothetical protein